MQTASCCAWVCLGVWTPRWLALISYRRLLLRHILGKREDWRGAAPIRWRLAVGSRPLPPLQIASRLRCKQAGTCSQHPCPLPSSARPYPMETSALPCTLHPPIPPLPFPRLPRSSAVPPRTPWNCLQASASGGGSVPPSPPPHSSPLLGNGRLCAS